MGNTSSSTDLYTLVDNGDVDALQEQLDANPDDFGIDLVNEDGETLLFRACTNGDEKVVAFLLEHGADFSIPCHSCGDMTAIHCAATTNSVTVLSLLLVNGADPNTICKAGSPLHLAFQYANFNAARLLIENGARIDLKNDTLLAPTEVDCEEGVEEFTDSQVASLKNLAAKYENGSTSTQDSTEDLETMRFFFREAGLGALESRNCAQAAVDSGAKTGKKLAVLVLARKINLRGLGMDEDDVELVNIAIRGVLPFYFEDTQAK
jgi:ankyrin repeat protein